MGKGRPNDSVIGRVLRSIWPDTFAMQLAKLFLHIFFVVSEISAFSIGRMMSSSARDFLLPKSGSIAKRRTDSDNEWQGDFRGIRQILCPQFYNSDVFDLDC